MDLGWMVGGGLVATLALAVLLFREKWRRARVEGALRLTREKLTHAEEKVDASERARRDEVGRRDAEIRHYQEEQAEMVAVLRECRCGSNAERLERLLSPHPTSGGRPDGGSVPS